MRVTWLSLEWPREGHHSGGVGRYVARLAERMRDVVDLTVVTFEGANEISGVRVVTLPASTSRFDRYYRSAWKARRLVAETSPQLVHAHGDDWLLRGNVPTVRSFYGSSWNEAKTSKGLRRANHVVLAGAEHLSQVRAETRLGIAPESVDRFRCQHTFPPYLRSVQQHPSREPSADPLVTFIGSYDGRKQGNVVQEAVEGIRRGGVPVRLVVVGPASDASSWAPWVEHRSGLSDDEVSALLSEAWVLASPSLYEGFGIPILEALDHGVPVVAYPNPGSEYLRGHASEAVPLTLANGVLFGEALGRRIVEGPSLENDEERAAKKLVEDIAALGSPERLLSLYQSSVSS